MSVMRSLRMTMLEGLDELRRAVWMTWYTAKWRYLWVELDKTVDAQLRYNWKTLVILVAHVAYL